MTRAAVCTREIPRPADENAGLRDDLGEIWSLDLSDCTTTRFDALKAVELLHKDRRQNMAHKIFLFTQAGCLNCEVMRIFLEAKGIEFEERDMTGDRAARAELLEMYHCNTAPTVVIVSASGFEVIEGYNPDRLDRFLPAA